MRKLDGETFGKLLVISTFRKVTQDQQGYRTTCRCLCNCGAVTEVEAYSLTSGRTTSCGCARRKTKDPNITGKKFKAEYVSWQKMKYRCYAKDNRDYTSYGRRGITVCDRWMGEYGFENFILDMGSKPDESYSIDRIDNDGNYCPENCRWATPKEQANNRRNSSRIMYKGEELTIEECANKLGIKVPTLRSRLATLGDKLVSDVLIKGLLRKPSRNSDDIMLTVGDETKSIADWSTSIGIGVAVLLDRYDAGWTHEKIVNTPVLKREPAGSTKNIIVTYNGYTKTLGEWTTYLGLDYSIVRRRYLNGLPLDKVFSNEKLQSGRNNLRGENRHIGERFGKLIVTGITSKKCGKGNKTYAVCNCDCGTTGKEILMTNLVTGKQKACGCQKGIRVDTNSEVPSDKKYSVKGIVGKRFDRLVVQEVIRTRTDKGNYVYRLRCKCDCGNETTINHSHIGVVKSCGCFRREHLKSVRVEGQAWINRTPKEKRTRVQISS